jgi:hypothetical protein
MKNPPAFMNYLFWDTALSGIDIKKNKTFIIERALKLGRPEQIRWTLNNYTKREISKVLENSVNIDPKTANYWAIHFGLKKGDIRCLRKQSTKRFPIWRNL